MRLRIGLAAVAVAAFGGLLLWREQTERQRVAALAAAAEAAFVDRDYDRLAEAADALLAARPADPRGLLLAARAARRQRRYEPAAEYVARYRAAGGDPALADLERTLADMQRWQPADVPAVRRRAEAGDEAALVALEVLIAVDLDTHQLRQAQAGLTRFLDQRPDDLQARLARGFVLERFLDFAAAAADYRRAVAAHPDHLPARLRLADALLLAGTPAEAAEQYEFLADRLPDRAEVRLGLARCRRRLGRPADAVPLLDRLLADRPDHPEALLERGELAMDQADPAAAESWLRRAVAAAPHDRRTNFALARCLEAIGKTADARAYKEAAARIEADLKRLEEVRNAVLARPADADLRYEGGRLFLANGERAEAARWFQMALTLDPKHAQARQGLAEATGRPAAPAVLVPENSRGFHPAP